MIITIINSNEWTSFSPYFHNCTTHVNNPSSLSQLVSTTEFTSLSCAPRYLLPGPTDIRLVQVTSFDQRNTSRSDITLAPRRSFKCYLWLSRCLSLFPLPGELYIPVRACSFSLDLSMKKHMEHTCSQHVN